MSKLKRLMKPTVVAIAVSSLMVIIPRLGPQAVRLIHHHLAATPDSILLTIDTVSRCLPALEDRVGSARREWEAEKGRLDGGNPQTTERSVAALLKVLEGAAATRDLARQRLANLDRLYQEAKNKRSLEYSDRLDQWLLYPAGEAP